MLASLVFLANVFVYMLDLLMCNVDLRTCECMPSACMYYIHHMCTYAYMCVYIYIYIYIMVESNQTSFMHLSESEVSDKLRLWLLTQRLLGVFCGHTLRVFGHVQRQVQNNC